MSLVTTRAIVLHTYPYGESSKIVRFATQDHGLMSAVAKGAHRSRSKFGARIQPLSEGDVSVYVKRNRDLQTLAEFEVIRQRNELAQHVPRYAAAAAMAELVLRCSPAAPHPELFGILQGALDWLIEVEPEEVEPVAMAGLWGTVVGLGFAPATEVCAVDGLPLEPGVGRFSVVDGGLLCGACSSSRSTSDLPADDSTLR